MKTSSPKKPSRHSPESLKVPSASELLDYSKYPNGIPYYNIYPYNDLKVFKEPVKTPVASKAYEINHVSQVQESKQNIFLSSSGDHGQNIPSDSNEAANVKLKQSEKHLKDLGKTISEAKYLHMLKLMRLTKYSIIAAAFSDILTAVFPLFIFPVIYALRGLKILKVLNLLGFLLYLLVASVPYAYLAYFVNRVEVYVVCGIIFSFKVVSFYLVCLFLAKTFRMQNEFKSRLIIDFNSNPGKNCVCCF